MQINGKNFSIYEINLDGGLLCLDFVNSVPSRVETPQADYLTDIQVLIDWAERLEVVDAKTAGQLRTTADKNIRKSEIFLRNAIAFRELLYAIFSNISEGKPVLPKRLSRFNAMVSEYFPYIQIKPSTTGFTEDWNIERKQPEKLLFDHQDAYEILLSGRLDRIGKRVTIADGCFMMHQRMGREGGAV
jgi:hypothetical protein